MKQADLGVLQLEKQIRITAKYLACRQVIQAVLVHPW